jgi:hypothetical protein
LAVKQSIDHAAAENADDAADGRIELDVGILQRLPYALRLSGAFAHQMLTVRSKSRICWVGLSGTKPGRISPCAIRLASQVESSTSVLRRGPFSTCAALANTSSKSPSDTICQTGFQ